MLKIYHSFNLSRDLSLLQPPIHVYLSWGLAVYDVCFALSNNIFVFTLPLWHRFLSNEHDSREGGFTRFPQSSPTMTNDSKGSTAGKAGKMDSRIGLEYIVENSDYVNKLGLALDTNNATVKKQVFELLSALCAYSSNGYKRAIETLEHYKVWPTTIRKPDQISPSALPITDLDLEIPPVSITGDLCLINPLISLFRISLPFMQISVDLWTPNARCKISYPNSNPTQPETRNGTARGADYQRRALST